MSRLNRGKLLAGTVLMTSFAVVLIVIFMPLFDGANALNYMDNLYNSISKDSAYYIPKVQHDLDSLENSSAAVALKLEDPVVAGRAATLLAAAGADTTADGATVQASGDVVAILAACLRDSEAMYRNNPDELEARYGIGGRAALHTWWRVLGAMEKDLNRQKRFALARVVHTAQTKAVECAYNYFGIEPQPIGERWGIVLFSLAFYVLYTVWYGFAVMFLFEGLGFRLTH